MLNDKVQKSEWHYCIKPTPLELILVRIILTWVMMSRMWEMKWGDEESPITVESTEGRVSPIIPRRQWLMKLYKRSIQPIAIVIERTTFQPKLLRDFIFAIIKYDAQVTWKITWMQIQLHCYTWSVKLSFSNTYWKSQWKCHSSMDDVNTKESQNQSRKTELFIVSFFALATRGQNFALNFSDFTCKCFYIHHVNLHHRYKVLVLIQNV